MVDKSSKAKGKGTKLPAAKVEETKETSVYVKNGSLMLALNVKPNSKSD
jgi:hypothetical protein